MYRRNKLDMKRFARLGALAAAGLLLASAADAGEVILGGATKDFEVTGRGRRAAGKKGGWHITGTKVAQVRNIRGNNPFHPREPVNNLNGRIIRPIVPPVFVPPAAAGLFAKYQIGGTQGGVALIFDPTTNTTNLLSQLNFADNRGIAIRVEPIENTLWALIPNPGVWQFQPPAGIVLFPFTAGSKSFSIRHLPTLKVYQVTIRPSLKLSGGVRLISITPL